MKVLTCADAGYFHFLPFFEANVERKFGTLPLIYDLGMTVEQRALLRAPVLQVPVPEGFRDHDPTHGFILTTHKPACIADALRRSPQGVLYADADVLFAAPLTAEDIGGADVAVTPRRAREQKPAYLVNGVINAGILWFADTAPAQTLLRRWMAACAVGDRSDQKALSDLLESFGLLEGFGPVTRAGLHLMRLDPAEFNDTRLKTGRVLHFKNAGRDPRVTTKLARARWWEEHHPRLLAAFLATRRRLQV